MTEGPSQRPDEVLPPEGGGQQLSALAKDAALMLPNIVKLVARLLADPRVPRRSKIALGMAAAYVASPVDLIPEFIPVLGWADDVIIVIYAIDSMIERAGPELVIEHWDGPGDLLQMVQEVMGVVRGLMPTRIASAIDRLVG